MWLSYHILTILHAGIVTRSKHRKHRDSIHNESKKGQKKLSRLSCAESWMQTYDDEPKKKRQIRTLELRSTRDGCKPESSTEFDSLRSRFNLEGPDRWVADSPGNAVRKALVNGGPDGD